MGLAYNLTGPQSDYFKLTAPYSLFVGGYGSGKTFTKIVCAIRDLARNPGARIALYDPTYDLLSLNTTPRLLETLNDLGWDYKFNKHLNVIKIWGIGEILLRSMDNPARIVGYEVFASHVDEIETMRPQQIDTVWKNIIARNRQARPIRHLDVVGRAAANLQRSPGFFSRQRQSKKKTVKVCEFPPFQDPNRVSVYTTPDMGFGFTYNLWGKDKRDGYQYVKAPTLSNQGNLNPDYIDNLKRSYPDNMVDAYLNGDWVNLHSGTVFVGFNRVANHSDRDISSNREQLHIGVDFNVGHMSAVVYLRNPDDTLVAVDEFADLYDTPDLTAAIRSKYPQNPIMFYPDATGRKRQTSNASTSDIAILAKIGSINAPNSNPRIRNRINSANAAFLNKIVKVNTNKCPTLTNALEQLPYGLDGLPNKTLGLDHITDAATYIIHRLHPLTRVTFATKTIQGNY